MSGKKRLLIILIIIFFVGCNKSILSMMSCKRTYKPLTDKKMVRGVITKVVEGESIYFGLSNKKTFTVIAIDSGKKWDINITEEKPSLLDVGDSVDVMIKK